MPHSAPTRKKVFLAPYLSPNLPTKYVNATADIVAIIIKRIANNVEPPPIIKPSVTIGVM